MKIASADIGMSSTRVFVEQDSAKERLRVWAGKSPDAPSHPVRDRIVLGAPPSQPQSRPATTQGGS